ncbi:aminoglycoside 6-adenylyltransferase, partial [Aquimarina celericrescens]|nr:aminoglycoside 6-adenylyltransferase [Aquimarina celericrescens]
MHMSSKNEIVNAIKEWGLQNSNVNCILHIGSLINNDNDKYSDIDVIVFCNNVSTFLFE